jgi:hypothetical protein
MSDNEALFTVWVQAEPVFWWGGMSLHPLKNFKFNYIRLSNDGLN